MTALPRNRVLIGDAYDELRRLPSASVDMVLTSPPYFRLRDYGAAGQLGAEQHVRDWVSNLMPVVREVHRMLVPSGTLWLNLGDTYSAHACQGAARKSLLLGPERLVLAMAEDGWVLRNKIVWAKTNTRPTSVKDRLSASWEPIYLFARSSQPGQRTFFDLDAIRVPHTSQPPASYQHRQTAPIESWRGPNADNARGLAQLKLAGRVGHDLGKNPGDVWQLASSNFRGGHHATFPVALAERAVIAGCPERRCVVCKTPQRRPIRKLGHLAVRGALEPGCGCGSKTERGLVLDPFMGAGTTALVAENNHRDWLGIELNPDYAALADRRVRAGRATHVPPGRRRTA